MGDLFHPSERRRRSAAAYAAERFERRFIAVLCLNDERESRGPRHFDVKVRGERTQVQPIQDLAAALQGEHEVHPAKCVR